MSSFEDRHIGLQEKEITFMLAELGYRSLDELTDAVIPANIVDKRALNLDEALTEEEALSRLYALAKQNKVSKSLIGRGYYETHTPKVIQRNVLENPAWYTAYTPYQPEISQGRLEALFYFQTMITELTGMDIANASLLDEATAAAEAMAIGYRSARNKKHRFLVSHHCHPQTKAILATRAKPMGITLSEFDECQPVNDWADVFGMIVQYPDTFGEIRDLRSLCQAAHDHDAIAVVATDLLALTILTPPAAFGADIVVGNTQRFGVPMGFGGPHAAFFASSDKYKRMLPGRLVGRSVDTDGRPAYRLALQTREQHIRREKATSNICTAQALLAIISTFYACYHGPAGLQNIAERVHRLTALLAHNLKHKGIDVSNQHYFDTLRIRTDSAGKILEKAEADGFTLNQQGHDIVLSLSETSTDKDVDTILSWFGIGPIDHPSKHKSALPDNYKRKQPFLTQAVFNDYHSETEMMRYLRRLADKDIALDRAMIPLGSCTMKLNAASEMTPISWPEFANIHPYAPAKHTLGYQKMIQELEAMLCEATGYDAISLQPNAGSQGEYAGLLAIKAYHESRGEHQRDICLIPSSAHGTNPASAQMANMQVLVVNCDEQGNVDLEDLQAKIASHTKRIAAIMVTYPSTHGVFEEHITALCDMIHRDGGQVYIDGANMNAVLGVAKPGKFGGDVSHLNLHKTFCIPHGGGGPGVGPVCVGKHLAHFLPKDHINPERFGDEVSAAPFGSAGILPISWMYLKMMGAQGLRRASQVAILSANYMAKLLGQKYSILYTGKSKLVAHEFILDTRPLKNAGVSVDDIAKRLIDFGFHAPTMSFPVAGTLMIEPTESESLGELTRFCRAMHIIYEEYEQILSGKMDSKHNPLVNAPHTTEFLLKETHSIGYDREHAVFPDDKMDRGSKYWPPVSRIDNVYGDKNLVCSCPSIEEYKT